MGPARFNKPDRLSQWLACRRSAWRFPTVRHPHPGETGLCELREPP